MLPYFLIRVTQQQHWKNWAEKEWVIWALRRDPCKEHIGERSLFNFKGKLFKLKSLFNFKYLGRPKLVQLWAGKSWTLEDRANFVPWNCQKIYISSSCVNPLSIPGSSLYSGCSALCQITPPLRQLMTGSAIWLQNHLGRQRGGLAPEL